jgi:uncharacterized membrane protein YeaQ/YmgE (transglycosylase-associated protein family)
MSEGLKSFLLFILKLVVILGIGALLSWIYYSLRKRDLFGGFIGGMVVAVIGAIIGNALGTQVLMPYIEKVIKFLVYNPSNVDVISSIFGAWGAVYIMNRLNHDKTRKKY